MQFITPLSQSWRSLKANRVYNIINILGLALGLASTFILFKITLYEWNTDKFQKNYDQICYATVRTTPLSQAEISNSRSFSNFSYSALPEIKDGTAICVDDAAIMMIDNNKYPVHLIAIDSVFPEIFNFPLRRGDYKSILTNSNGIILTGALSLKLFGKADPMGKTMEFLNKRLTVTGILEEFPGNSSFQFEAIVSQKLKDFWEEGSVEFIRLNNNADLKALNAKVIHAGKDNEQFSESITEYKPYKNLYFYYNGMRYRGFIKYGNIKSLKILFLIGFLLFGVSTFNYLNIYQVTLQKRAKEIGILCVHGAGKRYLAELFLKENLISIGISAFLVILIYSLLAPYAPVVLGKNLPIFPLTDMILLALISLIMVLLTSAITALRYRLINPLAFIKVMSTGKKALLSRRISMVIQYSVTIALIIVSLFFIRQLNYMLHSDMGFRQNNIITVPFFTRLDMSNLWTGTEEDMKKAREEHTKKWKIENSNQQYVVDEIRKNPYLQNLCFGRSPLTTSTSPMKNLSSGQDYQDAGILGVAPGFKDLYGIKMVEGRFFEWDKDQSRGDKVVINQTAKRFYGIDDISKCTIANRYWGADKKPFKIIGVVEDFSSGHLSKGFQPLVLFFFDDKTDNKLMAEITQGKEAETIQFLRTLYNKVNPGMTFTYQFVKDDVAKLYTEDKKLVLVYSLFTIIALIITSLGLFSFSIYDVQQRFKEIGIRKANGSGTWETVWFLTRSIFVLLGIAFVVAVPIAWYGIVRYLEGFANKAPVSWWIFALAMVFTLVISILTVILHSYRAATRNPVEVLRYE